MQDDSPDIFHFQFYIFNYQSGGHEGTRTPNFLLVREAVYQLTYVPKITQLSKKYVTLVKRANSHPTRIIGRLSS